MASIFIRPLTGRKYFAIYGTISTRINHNVSTEQYYLGKIMIPSGNVIFNDKLENWLQTNNLNMTYVYDKILTYAKNVDLSINFINQNSTQPQSDKILSENFSKSLDTMMQENYKFIDVLNSNQFDFGHIYLLNNLSESLGLTKILSDLFPSNWQQILTLAEYFAVECSPCLYCSSWVNKVDSDLDSQLLSSQRISELFASITSDSIFEFYERWSATFGEHNFFAFDNTSISTYSRDIREAEYGYNRDKEKLNQINLSVLFGEKSGLPLFSSLYHGSMNDVRSLKTTIDQFELLNQNNYSIIMDKGFFSMENIDFLTRHNPPIKFTISLPKTVNKFEELILDTLPKISSTDSVIITSSEILLGVSKRIKWDNGKYLYAHIYLDRHKKLQDEEIVTLNLIDMLNTATANPKLYINDKSFNKVLNFRKSCKTENGYIVTIKHDMLSKKSLKSGWVILLSNYTKDATQAIIQYRKKDVVEKAFNLLKNHNILQRVRVLNYKKLTSKVFVCFISLILLSKMHDVMDTNNLYSTYTMKQLFDTLGTLRIIYIKDEKILKPITAEQKRIFKFFKCPLPNNSNDFTKFSSQKK
ncbi:MAG: IS1634 family transposase [Deltaproteobacteria bacterium]|jgi:transposase|nr:IS1634 family transposase [Deltaproteobacteria bacterium]